MSYLYCMTIRINLRIILCMVTSLWALCAAHGYAELEIEEVVITTRAPNAIAPGNTYALGSSAVNTQTAVHVQQLMRMIPGVYAHRGSGQEGLLAIRSPVFTGAGACGSFLIMEESMPVRSFGLCNVNELFDTHFEQASRLEVVRGPHTAFYGSNALNGAINIVLPFPAKESVSLEVGPHDFRRIKGTFMAGESMHPHAFYATLSSDGGYRHDAGYEQYKMSWRHHRHFNEWQFAPGMTVIRLDQNTAGFILGTDSYLDESVVRQNFNPDAFRRSDAMRLWLRMTRMGDVNVQFTPYVRMTDMDFSQHFLPGMPREKNGQFGVGWQSSLRISLNKNWRVLAGLDGEWSRGTLLQSQATPTSGSVFLMATIPHGRHYDYSLVATQWAPFVEARWQWHPDWLLSIGVRYEMTAYDYRTHLLVGNTRDDGSLCTMGGCRYQRPPSRGDSFNHFSPKLQLQYRLAAQWRGYVALKNAFRVPQASELYRLQRGQSIAHLGNVHLDGFEAGIAWHGEETQWHIDVYHYQLNELIIRDANAFNRNGGRIRSSGIEVSGKGDWRAHGKWRLALSSARHHYASSRTIDGLDIKGKDVDTAPRLWGSALIQYNYAAGHIGAEVQYVGRYFLEPTNRYTYPGHSLVDVYVAYRVRPNWQLLLRVRNLFDRRYADRADYTAFTGERYFPGEPQGFFMQVQYDY